MACFAALESRIKWPLCPSYGVRVWRIGFRILEWSLWVRKRAFNKRTINKILPYYSPFSFSGLGFRVSCMRAAAGGGQVGGELLAVSPLGLSLNNRALNNKQ